jgi:hypothetical protein
MQVNKYLKVLTTVLIYDMILLEYRIKEGVAMKKSAMMQAFQTLQKKPLLLLLILPIQAVSILSLIFMPDYSKLLSMNNLAYYSNEVSTSLQMSYIIFLLATSVTSLITLIGTFVLLPPAMELLRDGAADVESTAGWYMRGLRKHWWKPIVSSLIVSCILGVIVFVLYIVLVVVMMIAMSAMASGFAASGSYSSVDGALNSIMPVAFGIGIVFGLIIAGISLVIQSVFALFLPALADRGFGESFKLLFSKRGFRKLPKLFGGLLLIYLVPAILNCAIFAAYILIKGIPNDAMGFLTLILSYVRSWPGILGMLLSAIAQAVVYPFQFCVFQQVKDEEATALVKQ